MKSRLLAPVLAGAFYCVVHAVPGLCTVAYAEQKTTQPVQLWSSQNLNGGQTNTVVFWSPGLGLEPKVRVKPTVGKVSEVVASGDQITVTWQAPSLDVPSRVHFQIKGKGESGPVEGVVDMLLEPAVLPPVAIALDPPVFNFGDAGVRVKITPPHSTLEHTARDLQLSASLGTISEPLSAGDGSWVARWEPPAEMEGSTVVIIAASEPGHQQDVMGWTVLPVQVKREVSFQRAPNSQNILRAGTQEWGPIQADASGTVTFTAALDPRIGEGQLQTISETSNETESVELFWESPDVFTLVPAPETAAADPTQTLPIHMIIVEPNGQPKTDASPELVAEHGKLSTTESIQPGLYRTEITPPAEPASGSLTMKLSGQERSQPLNFVPRAHRSQIQVEPSGLTAEQTETMATVTLLDGAGQAVTEGAAVYASGATGQAAPKTSKSGSTTQTLLLGEGTFETMVVGWPTDADATGLAPAQLLAWAPGASLPADGTTTTPLVVVAVDRFGQGVPGVAIDFRIGEHSTGWVTPSATTNNAGVAVVDYRAGRHFGPARVLVRSKGLESNALIYLHDGQSDPPAAPPASALQVRWMERVAATRLSRQRPADQPAPEVGPQAIPDPPVATAPSLSAGPTTTVPTAPVGPDGAEAAEVTGENSPGTPVNSAAVASAPAKSGSMGGLDVRSGLLVLGHSYAATSDAINYAPTASFDHTGLLGAPGIDLRASMEVQEGIHADLRGRFFTERMGAGDSVAWNTEWAVMAGAAYGQSLLPWFSWKGTAHLHHQALGAFQYANEARTELSMVRQPNWGLRLGGEARIDALDGFLEIEAAETFGLRPVDHHLGATAGWRIDEQFIGIIGFDLDIRQVRATLDSGTLEIEDRVQGIRVGVQSSL